MKHSKKILFIDSDDFQTNMRGQLLGDAGHEVVVVNSFEEVEILYQKNKFDLVIIDFARDFGAESLIYIDKIDHMQKMITISEHEEYSEEKGCDYCASHHQRRRLKPPFPFAELLHLVESFEMTMCTHRERK